MTKKASKTKANEVVEPKIKKKKIYNYMNVVGRPTTYTTELAIEFCSRLINANSVAEVCDADDMPVRSTIFKWRLENQNGEFSDFYENAQRIRMEGWADDVVYIADNPKPIMAIDKKGKEYIWGFEDPNNRKLRIESRKWLLAKLYSRIYGDRVGEDDDKTKTFNLVISKDEAKKL